MNIINLPPVLPGELDLEALNRSLLANEILLDWSQVEDAPEIHLAVLLAGLDLVEHSEILGKRPYPIVWLMSCYIPSRDQKANLLVTVSTNDPQTMAMSLLSGNLSSQQT